LGPGERVVLPDTRKSFFYSILKPWVAVAPRPAKNLEKMDPAPIYLKSLKYLLRLDYATEPIPRSREGPEVPILRGFLACVVAFLQPGTPVST
jgi:hypothetical protein